ncbi:LolA family protein [Pantanalinema rosaneae CENA516]|uniref:LolA family protein n=1 Tax=Pantanalinema rosaneae TaxID=1620701 RepID=UPI003D6DAF11
MKVLVGTIALLSTSLVWGGTTLWGQSPVVSQQAPLRAQSPSQTTATPDLSLLARASVAFVQSDRYQTESIMEVTGTTPQQTFKAGVQATTIVQSPKQFRAEIAYNRPDQTGLVNILVVGDGQQVWIYRADTQQYTVKSYAAFEQLDDSYFIGVSSLLFLQLPPDDRRVIAQGALADSQVIQELGLLSNPGFKGRPQLIDNQPLYAYEFTDAQEGFIVNAFVDPITGTLKQLRISGQAEQVDYAITETIRRRTANPLVTANTFRFTPPVGARRVESLAIGPL